MFKNKTFKFKNEECAIKFMYAWQGQSNQQDCLADFIGTDIFTVVSCTPLGAIRTIQRNSDFCYYYTELSEPLIDHSEIILFFDEVDTKGEI